MGTLYLDRDGLRLRPERGAVVVYASGARARTVPLALVQRVVARGDVELSSRLLEHLAAAGVGLAVLGRRPERVALLLGKPHADARIRLAQYQAVFEPARRGEWARALVAGKLAAQRRCLLAALELRGDSAPAPQAREAAEQLDGLRARLLAPSNAEAPVGGHLGGILGVEGAGAAAYFLGLSALFAPALGFVRRNRRPPRDPVNACLSLVYTLLHAEAVLAAHAAGLDPLLGFYHAPALGRESLASDLMEPLRPRADFWVWQIFRRRDLRAEQFSRESDGCFLGKAGRAVFYQAFEAQAPAWRRWLRRGAAALVAALGKLDTPRLLDHWEGEWEDQP